ncbi:MAG TPA: TraR/DksA C4-type zinc finger protein [Dokdonella sp.]|uniref:TraR/DksA family transcriptional regulator n=1 Tax=Dokdonella sp. TaxID=2291710 RepID=UPI002D7FC6BA|nr:TraR/DksA C4-type zinc finger protein [Dokdonella sp.]HET9034140.1 TraR/DksA C4-type zinc finger protein [Dokdonella sp.]
MKPGEIDAFRRRLLEQQADLDAMAEAGEDAARPVELDQSRMGRLSRIDALQGQQMAQEIERRRQQRLLAIKGALQRIESGDFGSCFVCDEDIDLRRLAANPVITRCIGCVST